MNQKLKNLLNEEIRIKYAEQIKELPTSLDKINFWSKIGLNWIEHSEYDGLHEIPLEPFKFKIPEEEYQEVNLWIIGNYSKYVENEEDNPKLLIYDELVEDYEEKKQAEIDKKKFIQVELMKIDKEFHAASNVTSSGNLIGYRFFGPAKIAFSYNASTESFYDFLEYNLTPDYSKVVPSIRRVIRLENGSTMGKFRLYLKTDLNSIDLEKTDLKEGSRGQKMLLLHNLGVLEHLNHRIPSKTKLAKILQLIIGASAENIEKDMVSIYNKRSPRLRKVENYEFLADALDIAGLTKEAEEARGILTDLYRIKQKK